MRTVNLVLFAILAALICMLFSAAYATSEHKTAGLRGQTRSLDFSKSVPTQLNYQGFLVDATDSSAATATLEMTFRLFDSQTEGAELWSETHPTVQVSNGIFHVLLGSVTPFPVNLFDGSPLWLQTEVGAEVLTPRKPLVSVAYSHRADDADQLEGQALTDLDSRWVNEDQASSVSSSMIADGAITDNDISATAAIDPAKIIGTAWTGDNDGTGSGLDADLLDGQQGSEFLSTTSDYGRSGIADSLYEGTTALADKYLGLTAKAADADKLDGMDSAAFSDTTHQHDERYYTEDELNTPGTINDSANPVDWTKLKSVPATFADGYDDVGDSGGVSQILEGDGIDVTNPTGPTTEITAEFGTGFTQVARGDHDHDADYVNEDQTSSITSSMITDGQIANADISASAAIDPSKISGTAWTANNDGAGSGLDADLLNGQQASEFLSTTSDYGRSGVATDLYEGPTALGDKYVNREDLDHLDAVDGSPGNAVYVDSAGQVGIGTTSPTHTLDVNGDVDAATYYGDGSHLSGISATDDDWTIDGDDIYHETGNVGIGTSSPEMLLDVSGGMARLASGLIVGQATWGVPGIHIYEDEVNPNLRFTNDSGIDSRSSINFMDNTGYLWSIENDIHTNGGQTFAIRDGKTLGYRIVIDSAGNVGIGTISPVSELDVTGYINADSLYNIRGHAVLSTKGYNNVYLGVGAGANHTKDEVPLTGYQEGHNKEAICNTFLGFYSGHDNTTGNYNTCLGAFSGRDNTAGWRNTFIGGNAGTVNSGICNTFLGAETGWCNAAGDSNVFIGHQAGYYASGSHKLYIAHGRNDSDVLIYGDFSTGRIGLGTINPSCKLDVRGDRIQIKEDASGDWIALRTDGGALDFEFQGGPLYMQSTVSGEDILLNPNSGNNVGVGLTLPNRKLYVVENVDSLAYALKLDNPNSSYANGVGILFSSGGNGANGLERTRGKGALIYELNSTWNRGKFHFLQDTGANTNNPDLADAVMTIQNNGNVGIGTTSPTSKLHVIGDIHCTGKLTSDGGNDPPYVLYDKECRAAIIERVAHEVPDEKRDGAVLFWNGDEMRLELYLPERGEFRDLLGNLLAEASELQAQF